MIFHVYSKKYGLSVMDTQQYTEHSFPLVHTDSDGNVRRLADIENDGKQWLAYSTAQARLILDRAYQDSCVLTDGFMCLVSVYPANDIYFLLCRDETAAASRVALYNLPVKGTLTIGYEQCDINYPYPLLSKCNTRLTCQTGKVYAEDYNSANGTYLNGRSIQKEELHIGDVLDLFGLRIAYLGACLAVCSHPMEFSASASMDVFSNHTALQEQQNVNLHLLGRESHVFERTPRIAMKQTVEQIQIDNPPAPRESEEMPLVFTVGSSALMSMSSLMMAMMSLQNAQTTGNMMTAMPSLFMAGSMFLGGLVMPVITRKYTDKKNQEKEEKRKRKFKAYLSEMEEKIDAIGAAQKEALLAAYPDVTAMQQAVKNRSTAVWGRMPRHHDFLHLRLGLADQKINVQVNYPRQSFSLEEDELRRALTEFEEKPRMITNSPFMLSLRDTGILGIYAEHDVRLRYVQGLLIQLCSQHSYQEMKLVIIHNKSQAAKWEWARWLPHLWSDNREMRTLCTDEESMRYLASYIDTLCPADADAQTAQVHCVVIIDDMRLAEQCPALLDRMRNIKNKPLSIIALADRVNQLPKECNSVITLSETEGFLYQQIDQMEKPVRFTQDAVPQAQLRAFSTQLSRMVLPTQNSESDLPGMLPFYAMLRMGNVGQADLMNRWRNSDPVKTLAAPVGVDTHGELMNLDIHQNAHGPHGLVAGMTGSGKSEFVITYLLSMAVHYSPLEVGFVLIDYKGGGMSDTLKDLPHVVGIIDNLGGKAGIHRSMKSITSELKRRQRIFKETAQRLQTSNLDIHKYQKLYRQGSVEEPLQHIIIVSDEFAELKQQEPDFMDDLVSAARIGRSLGVHLILATQKPTGVVNDQINSNTRFRVCLKVQDKSDSMEMLSRPEAALLTQTGRFYLQVGYNEIFALGQSAWSGAPSIPTERYVEMPDTDIELLNDMGSVMAKVKLVGSNDQVKREKQVDELVRYIHDVAKENNLVPQPLWKPMLQAETLLDDIDKEYDVTYQPYHVDPVVGLVDDPTLQLQYPMQIDLSGQGNAVVYGMTGSGKSMFVSALIYSLCRHHSPEELNIYCLDFAAEASRMFSAMPQVGDVIVSGDDEKIHNLMQLLQDEISMRRKILSAYAGSLDIYRSENKNANLPNIVVLVDNYTAFAEGYEAYDDLMYQVIREGPRFGIYTLITAISSTSLRFRLSQCFKQIFCMQMPDKSDYSLLLGNTEGAVPTARIGSGLYRNETVLEYQIATLLPEDTPNPYQAMQKIAREMEGNWKGSRAQKIRTLPDTVMLEHVWDGKAPLQLNRVPVGMDKESMAPVMWNLYDRYMNQILYSVTPEYCFPDALTHVLAQVEGSRIVYLDAMEEREAMVSEKTKYFGRSKLVEGVHEAFNEVLKRHNTTKEATNAGRQPPVYPEYILVINGMDRLHQCMTNEDDQQRLLSIFKFGSRALRMCVVYTMQPDGISVIRNQEWYGQAASKEGIWLGEGYRDQHILSSPQLSYNAKLPEGPYGFLLQNGKAYVVKMLEKGGK